jgi:hypothetical protein
MSRLEIRKQEIFSIPLYEKTGQCRNIKTLDRYIPMEKGCSYGEYVFQKILGEFSHLTDPDYLYRLAGIMAQQVCRRPSNHSVFYFLWYSTHTMSKTLNIKIISPKRPTSCENNQFLKNERSERKQPPTEVRSSVNSDSIVCWNINQRDR